MSDPTPNRAYLLLGSNIDPQHNLAAAAQKLVCFGRILAVSRVWETVPVGCAAPKNFLNAAVLLETRLTAHELRLTAIAEIEASLGRVRDPHDKNAPRTIDIDIVLFNREVLQIGHRRIPDPSILDHSFVAVPLAEIDPDYIHPETNRSLAEIARDFEKPAADMHLRADVRLLDQATQPR